MNFTDILIVSLAAYALGSIATAVWAGKIFHGIDVREHGSGNAGATNTIRVLGWATGLPVLILDMAKGWLAASLPLLMGLAPEGSTELINVQILTGSIAIIGHVFPVFAGFKGGKGVATTFGVLFALHPMVTLSCLSVFLVIILISGYVSASSIVAGFSFPIQLFLFFETPSLIFKLFSVLIGVAIIVTHKKNIKRLLNGEEKRFIWKNRGKQS